jgi:hypothetical protein
MMTPYLIGKGSYFTPIQEKNQPHKILLILCFFLSKSSKYAVERSFPQVLFAL